MNDIITKKNKRTHWLLYGVLAVAVIMVGASVPGSGTENYYALWITNNTIGDGQLFLNEDNITMLNTSYGVAIYAGDWSGWVDYVDTQYNDSNRFTAPASTVVHFPNNAGLIRDMEIPPDVNATGGFYNGSLIIGRYGDAYEIKLRGWVEPQAANVVCVWSINIGGSIGPLNFRTVTFPKGAGVAVPYNFATPEYTLDTWETNGGNVTVDCTGNTEFWNGSMVIHRIHKGRNA